MLAAALVACVLGISGGLAVGAPRSTAGTGTTSPTTPTVSGGSGLTLPSITLPGLTIPAITLPLPGATGPYTAPVPPPTPIPTGRAASPFATRGMWIWILGSSDGGSLDAIVSEAKRYGISTLMIKGSDGIGMWPQFNSTLVGQLHAAGLHVCAWQYVYGAHPILEAQAGAQAVKDGADCLVIDAEVEYQGRYVQAQRYVAELRRLIGSGFPVALAGFPYIDYHPGFPYSVFLGPGGAQYNAPQMYWKTIGVTVDSVYAHTYEFNELYQRPIAPLGQIYDSPSLAQIRRFRSISRYYGATGVSWWDWQSGTTADFRATAQPVGSIPGFVPHLTVASIGRGAIGDLVVWAQEHLVAAGDPVTIDGDFGPLTQAAVATFQVAHGLAETGVIDPSTWTALLRYAPATVTWVIRKKQLVAKVATETRARHQPLLELVPRSASAPELADELAGAGGPRRPEAASSTQKSNHR